MFKLFKVQVENQFNTIVKMLQSDRGGGGEGEYRAFTDLLNQNRIIFKHSCPYTHHQNDLVKIKRRHIVELGLILLVQASLPFKFWWDVVHTTVFHINRLPTPLLKFSSPYEKLF